MAEEPTVSPSIQMDAIPASDARPIGGKTLDAASDMSYSAPTFIMDDPDSEPEDDDEWNEMVLKQLEVDIHEIDYVPEMGDATTTVTTDFLNVDDGDELEIDVDDDDNDAEDSAVLHTLMEGLKREMILKQLVERISKTIDTDTTQQQTQTAADTPAPKTMVWQEKRRSIVANASGLKEATDLKNSRSDSGNGANIIGARRVNFTPSESDELDSVLQQHIDTRTTYTVQPYLTPPSCTPSLATPYEDTNQPSD